MDLTAQPRPWWYRYRSAWLVVIHVLAAGCVDETAVLGNIPPTTFQFTTVIEHDGVGPGGWQVAQVAVLLGRLSATYPRTAVCEVEVGMPVVSTAQGYISVERAQISSALSSDRAAHELLSQRGKPTGQICKLFLEKMQKFLTDKTVGNIAGARVSRFNRWPGKKIPRQTFPPRRGKGAR